MRWRGGGLNTFFSVMVPQGNYRCALVGWDLAGNLSDPDFIDLVVNVSAREMLEDILEKISVNITDLGLLVQLTQRELFSIKDGKPSLNKKGEEFLNEVALLINAYPDVSVKLDGYSKRFRSASRDRDRSSLYAWSVYSHLVKKANVKASRITVRGQGRFVLEERSQIEDPPVIRNGIEVLLEGDRDW